MILRNLLLLPIICPGSVVTGNSGDGYSGETYTESVREGRKKEAVSRSPNVARSGRNSEKTNTVAQYFAWKKRKEAGAGQKGREPVLKGTGNGRFGHPCRPPLLPTTNDVKTI